MYWALGLVLGRLVVWGQEDDREELQIEAPQKNYDWEGSPRRNTSLAKQGRGQKVRFTIKSNPLKDSIGKGEYKGSIRHKGAKKYLKESCCYRFEYSTANPLSALM